MSGLRRHLPAAARQLSGGLADLGLLLPLSLALIAVCGMSATAVFGLAGVAYIGTALWSGLPLPVQPLKAFAAAAIALELDAETIAAGALLMGVTMALIAVTGAADGLARRFPLVLVRGVQASVALLLGNAAVGLAQRGNWSGLPPIDAAPSLILAAVVCAALVGFGRRMPIVLVALGLGALLGAIVAGGVPEPTFGPTPIDVGLPERHQLAVALGSLVLAQLPLTLGNSVVATADAARSYFGERAQRVRPGRLAGSIGGWNVLAGLVGGLPLCHGAGGLTAHVKCGARSPWATVAAGAVLLVAGVVVGRSLPAYAQLITPGVLAGMLLYVALQHALLAGQLERAHDRVLVVAIGLTTLLSGSLLIGFGLGVVVLLGRRVAAAAGPRAAPEAA